MVKIAILILALTTTTAHAQFAHRITLLQSKDLPVSVEIQNVSRRYHSELKDFIYTIDYSITNHTPDAVLGRVAFIAYDFDEKGEPASTSFWGTSEPILPLHTKQLSTSTMFGDYENRTSVWVAHEICLESGSGSMDLSGVEKSVKMHLLGKQCPLPKAKWFLYPKCGLDE